MKVRIDIDCTPEEARSFFGLPDVSGLQDELMTRLRERLVANIEAMDPETILKTWMPAGAEGWDKMVRRFWEQMAAPTKKGG